MSDFFGKLKSGAGKVAFEADKMTRLNRAQGEVNQIKRQIEANYTKLGEMYYHKFINQEPESPAFGELCCQIADLEKQMTAKNEEVQRINAETYNPQGAPAANAANAATAAPAPTPMPTPAQPQPQPIVTPPPAPVDQPPLETFPGTPTQEAMPAAQTRFCPNCGKEQPAGIKFCTECGAKLA